MKNLILRSAKISKSLYSLNIKKIGLFNTNEFGTSKQYKNIESNHVKINDPQVKPIQQNKLTLSERKQAQKQAYQIIESYITIDQIRTQPGAITSMLLKLIKVFEYDKQNNGRLFYQKYRQKINKLVYDLKSFNSQSYMSPREILLVFYLIKLLSDCGYVNRIQGFEFRCNIKLQNHIVVYQKDKILQPLTANQVIYGHWLMSRLRCNNHQYKWKCFQMISNLWNSQKRSLSPKYINENTVKKSPLSLQQITSLLEAYFIEQIHLNTQYKNMQTYINILFIHKQQLITVDKYRQNQSLVLQLLSYLFSIQLHWINGKGYAQLFTTFDYISKFITHQFSIKLFNHNTLIQTFLNARNIQQFLQTSKYQTCQFKKYNNKLNNQSNNKLDKNQTKIITEEQAHRYFIFLNQMRQNRTCFISMSSIRYAKIDFLITQLLQNYFQSKIKQKQSITLNTLSIYTRSWITKKQQKLQELQNAINRLDQNLQKSQLIKTQLQKLVKDFQQLLQLLTQIINQKLKSFKSPKKVSKLYLTAQQKQLQKQKNTFLRNVELNLIKQLVDFIFANGKHSLMNSKLISTQKLSMIDSFEDFITNYFGDKVGQINVITIQNSYFWILKYMRLQSVNVADNKLLLKEFEQFLMKYIIKNVASKNPVNYSIVSIYNFYAYMCKLQQKMMHNQNKHTNDNSEQIDLIQSDGFQKKKEYQYFLAYKNYLGRLIFSKQSLQIKDSQQKKDIKKQQGKRIQIPKSLRIDNLYIRTFEGIQKQRDNNILRVQQYNKNVNSFNIQLLFNIIFRCNRYYNHKILSQQILFYLFGQQKLLHDNIMQYITNTNQRSGYNCYQFIYLILFAGNKQFHIGINNKLGLKTIKSKLIQSLNQKSKGSLISNILRQIFAPRKTSYMKKTPLKYRLKPYSIFQTVSSQSVERKKQILTQFSQHFQPNKSQLFGWTELLLSNLNLWGNDKAQIVSQKIIPWLTSRIMLGQYREISTIFYISWLIRMIRQKLIQTTPLNQKYFINYIDLLFPRLFLNLQRNEKQHAYASLIGLLMDIERCLKQNKFSPKYIHSTFLKCQDNLMKTGNKLNVTKEMQSKYFLKLNQLLQNVILISNSQKNHRNYQKQLISLANKQNKDNHKETYEINSKTVFNSKNKESKQYLSPKNSQNKLFNSTNKRNEQNSKEKKGLFGKKNTGSQNLKNNQNN